MLLSIDFLSSSLVENQFIFNQFFEIVQERQVLTWIFYNFLVVFR